MSTNIEKELRKKWISVSRNVRGFDKLQLAYNFFVKCDPDGDMVFSKHCAYFEEMHHDQSEIDFTNYVMKNIDFTNRYVNYATHDVTKNRIDEHAEKVAIKYFREQARRLDRYINVVLNTPITGAVS